MSERAPSLEERKDAERLVLGVSVPVRPFLETHGVRFVTDVLVSLVIGGIKRCPIEHRMYYAQQIVDHILNDVKDSLG